MFRDENASRFIVSLQQIYYTLSFDPRTFFADNVTIADVSPYTAVGNPLVYLASVTYGRAIYYFVASRRSAEEVKASLEAGVKGPLYSASVTATASHKQVLNESTVDALIIGGSSDAAATLLTSEDRMAALHAYVRAGATVSPSSPGLPLSYTAAYVSDLSVALLSATSRYTETRFVASAVREVHLRLNTTGDDLDEQEGLSVAIRNSNNEVLTPNGEYFICKRDARNDGDHGEVWPDYTTREFDIPLRVPVPLTEFGGLQLEVRKEPYGSSQGCGWEMTLQVTGRIDDGRTFTLLPETLDRYVGDGHPYVLHFPFMNPYDPSTRPDGRAIEDQGGDENLVH
jgi:hypothetical protein